MHVVEVGVAALGEGAQQVQRRRRLAIGLEQRLRIGHARLRRELDAVDDVAAIARQLDAVALLGRRRTRLGELAGDAADLHHWRGAGKVSTTAICRKTRKKSRMLSAPCSAKLSAQSPPCSRKAWPLATSAERSFRSRASPAKTSGGKVASCSSTSANACRSGIVRHLRNRLCAPAVGRPTIGHHHYSNDLRRLIHEHGSRSMPVIRTATVMPRRIWLNGRLCG